MKRFLSYSIIFPFAVAWSFCQTPEEKDFNRAFMYIYMHEASEDVNRALKSADSLYEASTTPVHKVRALMLKGDMYHRIANRDSAIHYAIVAEQIAKKADMYDWQARIYGVLSSQHREIGLFSEGKKYLEQGLDAIEKVEEEERKKLYKGQYHQELGFYAIDEKDYREAIDQFKRATVCFEGVPESVNRTFSLAQNDERLGLCYLKLDDIDSAGIHYQNALKMEQAASGAETPLKGFIYNGLGRVHLANKHYQEADSCIQLAFGIAERTGFPHLQIGVYQSLSLYYQAVGNTDKQQYYNELYAEAERQNTALHRQYADHILTRIQQKLVEMTVSNRTISLAASVFTLLAAVGAGLYVRKQRNNQLQFKKTIDKLRAEVQRKAEPVSISAHATPSRDKDLIPEATKQELLKKLERFESSLQFNDRNISIAVLAGKMKTNTKYLSYIINNYRNKDFNSYINELRINYIISKFGEDNRYLKYKISYLAEECGFATHSQFTTVFRNVTGLSPSTFMAYLKKEGQAKDAALLN